MASAAADDIVIDVVGMHKWFGPFHVLRDIDLSVRRGERIVICGPSGSGKSTLIRCINRLEEHQKGSIVVDGIELTREIRNAADSANRFVPIVMVSGYAQRGRVLTARDAGVNEFVVKPITATALFSRIRAVIEKPRPFVRTKTFFGPDRRRGRSDYEGPERRGTGEGTVIAPAPTQAMEQAEINRLFDATPDDGTAEETGKEAGKETGKPGAE